MSTQITHPDGRVELTDPSVIADSQYANAELAPVPVTKRTWHTYNYAALWIGMSHNLPTYALAAGLIAIGMNALHALLTTALGNLLALVPTQRNNHAGIMYADP